MAHAAATCIMLLAVHAHLMPTAVCAAASCIMLTAVRAAAPCRPPQGLEANKLVSEFLNLDVDVSGVLEYQELADAARAVQPDLTDSELLKLFGGLDVDNTGGRLGCGGGGVVCDVLVLLYVGGI